MGIYKLFKWGAIFLSIALLILFYKAYNPYEYSFFPKCPFLELTGWQCPGCGSQRAIHFLLNLDFAAAFRENALLVISIPYALTGFAFEAIRKPGNKMLRWRQRLFGRNAIFIILIIIVGFWILRNLI